MQDCGGRQGAGARENRGRNRAGSGRTGAGSGSRNKEDDNLLFITGYYSVKNTYLAKPRNFHLNFGSKKTYNRAGSGRTGAGSGIHLRAGSGSRNKEDDNLLFITGYYSVKNTYLAKPRNFHLNFGSKKT